MHYYLRIVHNTVFNHLLYLIFTSTISSGGSKVPGSLISILLVQDLLMEFSYLSSNYPPVS